MAAVEKITARRKAPVTKWIPIADLFVDRNFQRPLNENFVAKITEGFVPEMLGVLDVSDVGNGTYSVYDGQHRLAALRLMNREQVLCSVSDLTPERQAELFVRLQMERRRVHTTDQHRAAVFSGDVRAVALDKIVTDGGWRIANAKNLHGVLACAGALNEAFERYGPESIERSLDFIDQTWGKDDVSARNASVVHGAALFFFRYPEVPVSELAAKLGKHPAQHVIRMTRAHKDIGLGKTYYAAMARVLVDEWNKGKTTNRLPLARLGRAL